MEVPSTLSNRSKIISWMCKNYPGNCIFWRCVLFPHDKDGNLVELEPFEVLCIFCLQTININEDKSTSNLIRHIKLVHKEDYAKLNALEAPGALFDNFQMSPPFFL